MTAALASIPLLRFCVGPMYFAVAAEDVVAVVPAHGDAVHIGAILGLDPGAGDRRIIHLSPPPGHPPDGEQPFVSFQADQPVDVVRCGVEDLLPLPRAIPRDAWKPVMGFARIAAQLTLLLDIPSVVARLMDQRGGGLT